jgi:hypothetical protein
MIRTIEINSLKNLFFWENDDAGVFDIIEVLRFFCK